MILVRLFQLASGADFPGATVNADAFRFLCAAYDHFHAMHNFIKAGKRDPHEFIMLMAETNQVFSLPFYVKHADALQISVLRVVNGLAEEVSLSLVADVALITLGFDGRRKMLADIAGKE